MSAVPEKPKPLSNPAEPAASNKIKLYLNGFRPRTPAQIYAAAAVMILAATTFLWALLGAEVQQHNSDELANSYLFQNDNTFSNADLPGAHSFLIKWPLYFIIKLFGYGSGAFIAVTVLTVLVTVGALAWVLFRIERRPAYFATLCLALASTLLIVPAQPVAGGLLPVNMAMLATRNLEYAVFVAAVFLFVTSRRLRDWRFWLSALLLGLLVASDKLFLALAVGGAVLMLVVYSLRRKWEIANISARWLVNGLIAAVVGVLLLSLINAAGLTNITSGGAPYSQTSGPKDLALGILYGVLGLLTNFGANPAYDARFARNIPGDIFHRLFSLGGPAYLVNILIFASLLLLAYRLVKASLLSNKRKVPTPSALSLIMLGSALAALAVFIFSDHYYFGDARYLTVAVFALFISAATELKNYKWSQRTVTLTGLIICAAMCFGVVTSIRIHDGDQAALASTNSRNNLITQALRHHPVSTLVGDYWRVLPIRQESANSINVTPLDNCTTERDLLSSTAWQPDLRTHSFAYLLTLDNSHTDYPQCNLKEVLAKYGHPNSSILIAGTFSHPDEQLLIYDHGIHFSQPNATRLKTVLSTVLPVNLGDLTQTSCTGPTALNIVAHQDDDLLFMNPDITNDVKQGYCERTIYMTAGDAGFGQYYWLSREQGSEAAYSRMIGNTQPWVNRIVRITDNEYVTIANPRGNNSFSLIFVHLPDGGLTGEGFPATGHESLQKLESGKIKSMTTVDRQSTYTQQQLISMLASLMHIYQPALIRTQANFISDKYPDHSDHMAVGRLVKSAHAQYEKEQFDNQVDIPLTFYIGYPIHGLPANISDGTLQTKEAIFLDYAKYDGGVCQTATQCSSSPTYGAYLSRQYQNGY